MLPGLGEINGLTGSDDQHLLAVIVFPAAGVVEFLEMVTPPFSEIAPFLGDLRGHAARNLRRHDQAPSVGGIFVVARALDATATRE